VSDPRSFPGEAPEAPELRAWLDELARLHRDERAPEALRRSLIERLAHAPPAPSRTAPARWSLAALAALVMGVALLAVLALRSAGQRPRAGMIVQPEPSIAATRAEPPPGCPDYPGVRDAAALLKTVDRDVLLAGLQVHALEQQTPRCGPIQRRYLSYVPPSLPRGSTVPVLLVLHSGPDRAEGMWAIQTRRRFDMLASRNSFIVVYANAVPGHGMGPSVPARPNEGRWQTNDLAAAEFDDDEYLQLVVEDLLRRGVIDGQNEVFLVGQSEGANLALQAAARRPDFYAGVAAFMPYVLVPPPVLPPGARLSKALFVVQEGGGMAMAKQWALSLGVPRDAVDAFKVSSLPDPVKEGRQYEGDSPIAVSTRDSTVDRVDLWSDDPRLARSVRVFELQGAGHIWPNPVADDDERLIDSLGFRNQDIDGADETWRFFSGRK
jgi:poly(3-hydroxybutyrate) depolymerase